MIAVLCMTFQCPFPQNPHSVRNRGQFANVCYSEKRQLERPKAIGLISSQSATSNGMDSSSTLRHRNVPDWI
jgi:hypothetical protein